MLDFTRLYTALDATTSTLEKRRLLRDFFASQAADDAAVALFFLTGGRLYRSASTKLLRTAIIEATGLPGWLVTECREQVGDLSETLALLHPGADEPSTEALSATYRDRLKPFEAATDDAQRRAIIEHAWGDFDADQRLVFHKLIRGGFPAR
jgi:DNA ligase-1